MELIYLDENISPFQIEIGANFLFLCQVKLNEHRLKKIIQFSSKETRVIPLVFKNSVEQKYTV